MMPKFIMIALISVVCVTAIPGVPDRKDGPTGQPEFKKEDAYTFFEKCSSATTEKLPEHLEEFVKQITPEKVQGVFVHFLKAKPEYIKEFSAKFASHAKAEHIQIFMEKVAAHVKLEYVVEFLVKMSKIDPTQIQTHLSPFIPAVKLEDIKEYQAKLKNIKREDVEAQLKKLAKTVKAQIEDGLKQLANLDVKAIEEHQKKLAAFVQVFEAPPPPPASSPSPNCKDGETSKIVILKGYYIDGMIGQDAKGLDENGCANACLNGKLPDGGSFECHSAQFKDGKCTLSKETRAQEAGSGRDTKRGDATYFQQLCLANALVKDCPGFFYEAPQKTLVGQNTKTITVQARTTECAQACLEAPTKYGVKCASILYYYMADKDNCILNVENKITKPNSYVDETKATVTYFELGCRS